jgi:WD40 repeat protein
LADVLACSLVDHFIVPVCVCVCVLQCIVWNVEQAEPVNIIDCHKDTIFSIAWSREGSLFATTSKDKQLRAIDPRVGTVIGVSRLPVD